MRSENPGAVVSRALSRLEPLRSVRTDALEVAYFEAGPSVLITSSSTSTRLRRAVTSPRGNSRTSSLPRCERLLDHCASWREGDGGHHVCPSSHATRGHIDVAINLVSYQFAFSRAKFNDKRCTVVQSNVIC
jgi:hypothetical protein